MEECEVCGQPRDKCHNKRFHSYLVLLVGMEHFDGGEITLVCLGKRIPFSPIFPKTALLPFTLIMTSSEKKIYLGCSYVFSCFWHDSLGSYLFELCTVPCISTPFPSNLKRKSVFSEVKKRTMSSVKDMKTSGLLSFHLMQTAPR